MTRNYIIMAWRNILKNKVFALINIFGLALGLAACMLIMHYVRFEWSYDRFHEHADRTYRVLLQGPQMASAANHPGVGPALKDNFPEVAAYARMVHQSIIFGDNMAISYDDGQANVKMFNENHLYDVDTSFLTMFSFPFVYGDPAKAFPNTGSIVISEAVSKKFFGDENPLGKRLRIFGRFPFTVSGVFKEVPENSHLKFDILLSTWMRNRAGFEMGSWPEFYTYIQLTPQADPQQLEAKLEGFLQQYLTDRKGEKHDALRLRLQPITDIHLRSPRLTKERVAHGSERTVYFLMVIGLLILVIAWTNYINLSTAKAIGRAQEVGLRKVVGASRQQLIAQFLCESALVNLVAAALSLIIMAVAFPHFNALTGKNMGATLVDVILADGPRFWVALAAVLVLGPIFTGLYPALVLSSFKAATALRGKFFRSPSGIATRQALVGSQFAISIALIAGTIVVFRQVSFMRTQDLGYEKDQLLVIKTPFVVDTLFHQKLQTFKTALKRNPAIRHMTHSNEVPGKMISQVNSIRNREGGAEGLSSAYHLYISTDFIGTYGLDLLAGRNFREDEEAPSPYALVTKPIPIIVNEKAAEVLGYQSAADAVHRIFTFGWGARNDWEGEIVGVVSNHHQRSLREGYDPILYFHVSRPTPHLSGQYVTINLSMQHPSETVAFIEDQYQRAFPGNVFEYFFLDDYFDRQYAADQQFGKVFGLFSALALIVACLGLFGLSTFMIAQRTQEMAVRKVFGATIASMVALFSKDFVRLIAIANVAALPVVYILVRQWLDSFAFRINIGWLALTTPAAILLAISLTTVAVQTLRMAWTDMVRSLQKGH